MTISQGSSPLDIMTQRDVRSANEAGSGVAVLSPSLDEILWANSMGRALLGLPRGTTTRAALPANLPAMRQIKAAVRLVAEQGQARILLRSAAGLGSKPVVADLKRSAAEGGGFVLLSVAGLAPAAQDAASLAERLLSESGVETAAVVGEMGILAATSDFDAEGDTIPASEIATFIASDQAMTVVEGSRRRTLLARVAERLVLVRHEAVTVAEPQAAPAESDMPEAAPEVSARRAEAATEGWKSLFSVKRRRLPEGRGRISMNALVERWHSRQGDEAPLGDPREASRETPAALAPDGAASTSDGVPDREDTVEAVENPQTDIQDGRMEAPSDLRLDPEPSATTALAEPESATVDDDLPETVPPTSLLGDAGTGGDAAHDLGPAPSSLEVQQAATEPSGDAAPSAVYDAPAAMPAKRARSLWGSESARDDEPSTAAPPSAAAAAAMQDWIDSGEDTASTGSAEAATSDADAPADEPLDLDEFEPVETAAVAGPELESLGTEPDAEALSPEEAAVPQRSPDPHMTFDAERLSPDGTGHEASAPSDAAEFEEEAAADLRDPDGAAAAVTEDGTDAALPAEAATGEDETPVDRMEPEAAESAASSDEAAATRFEPAEPAPASEAAVPALAADTPAAPAPKDRPDEGPSPMPSEAPGIGETDAGGGETAQPVDRESIVILPDIAPEDAADLDTPIFDDAEVPPGEAMIPGDEATPDGALPGDVASRAAPATADGDVPEAETGLADVEDDTRFAAASAAGAESATEEEREDPAFEFLAPTGKLEEAALSQRALPEGLDGATDSDAPIEDVIDLSRDAEAVERPMTDDAASAGEDRPKTDPSIAARQAIEGLDVELPGDRALASVSSVGISAPAFLAPEIGFEPAAELPPEGRGATDALEPPAVTALADASPDDAERLDEETTLLGAETLHDDVAENTRHEEVDESSVAPADEAVPDLAAETGPDSDDAPVTEAAAWIAEPAAFDADGPTHHELPDNSRAPVSVSPEAAEERLPADAALPASRASDDRPVPETGPYDEETAREFVDEPSFGDAGETVEPEADPPVLDHAEPVEADAVAQDEPTAGPFRDHGSDEAPPALKMPFPNVAGEPVEPVAAMPDVDPAEPMSADVSAEDQEAADPVAAATSEPLDEAEATLAPPPGIAPAEATFSPRFDVAPVRFVWQIDRDGRFHALSQEFGAAVGPRAADVLGRSFREVGQVFGFDQSGEIARLLDRRDTWSGRSILWPVENSDRKVPVDLAALPVYARDRSFDGFRGFGIVKMNEWQTDPDAVGLVLAGRGNAGMATPPERTDGPEQDDPHATEAPRTVFKTFEADGPTAPFGRRQEPPRPEAEASQGAQVATGETPGLSADSGSKVVRLEERRRPKDGALSVAEEAAFRAIGMKLGSQSEAESPGALRFAAADEAIKDVAPDAAEPVDHPDDRAAEPLATGDEDTTALFDSTRPAEVDLSNGRPAEEAFAPQAAEDREADVSETLAASSMDADLLPASPHETVAETLVPDATVEDGGVEKHRNATDETADETGTDDEPPADAPEVAGGLESLFGSLPIPVLVQVRESLVYANREFADLTGYADVAALQSAGGLDRLFVERDGGVKPGELAIRRSNGQVSDVRVHMQRIRFSGRASLLMSFSPSPRDSAAAVHALPAEPAAPPETEMEDLRQQVDELQAVLDTATDGVVLLDPAGMIRGMNGSAHALFGIAQNDHAGRHLSSLFAHESQKATIDYLEMLRDNGLAGILNDGREVIGRVAQGGFIPLFITVGRLTGDRGWCVVIRDIAHWKRIEEDLVNARRQAEAASLHKSRFLANISHELRTPLNAIIGFADVMASECFGPIGNERYLEYLGDIKRSGHHVLDLVNDLLDISKIEAGKLDLAFEAVSLNEVVSEVVSLMQPQANRERVIVRSNLPSSVPPVVADRRTMRQIALNLVANAIRFTPAGGQIIASTTYTAEGHVLLRFRDSGIGMTEREIEIALTPFQQVHAPSANRGEGTGLGLPLTKAMVEANRANFSIHSTPGEGTLVEISFPSQRVLAD